MSEQSLAVERTPWYELSARDVPYVLIGHYVLGRWTGIAGQPEEKTAVGIDARDKLEGIIVDVLSKRNRALVDGPPVLIDDNVFGFEVRAEPPFANPQAAAAAGFEVYRRWQAEQEARGAAASHVDTFIAVAG